MLIKKDTLQRKIRIFISFLFFYLFFIVGCKSHVSLNLKKFTVKNKLHHVDYFIGYPSELSYEKIVLLISGTGRFSASQDFGKGSEASLYGFSVVYPEKSFIQDSTEYFKHDNRKQRMYELKTVIDDLIKKGTKKILILSESEGTMLAPEIAKLYQDKICGLISLGGSIFPFKDDILFASENRIGQFEKLLPKNNVENIFREIENQPDNVEKEFMGHSYRFWNSYLEYNPIDDLKLLTCPILYVNGEYDELDIMKQKSKIDNMRKDGINIRQIVYEGVGHKMGNKKSKMVRDILIWLKNNKIVNE
ncbi:MAG TPA: hypothetical protein ENK44_03765 [Caldithrix abyssi]|uniref:Alpha/beta hydrolase n=1 Tax=Caldithrix abyssi TaxID=187145 RepID=A0A7V4WUG4_CALAY|nr:hypothetical protein [Caldithrix abyssi]